jgi:hypothetical protein
MARSFLPHPNATNKQLRPLSRTSNKLSWGFDDEDEEGLPEVSTIEIVLDISKVIDLQSAVNAFLAQTVDGSFMFTGMV